MIFGEPIAFGEIIGILETIEKEINR